MKRGKSRRLFKKKKSHSSQRLGCIIAVIVLIPICYGLYLYYQQYSVQHSSSQNQTETSVSRPIPSGKDLEIPVSSVPRQEQIIHHKGYTVSYNKDLKIPNWVSYELTRQETKGKETYQNQNVRKRVIENLSLVDYVILVDTRNKIVANKKVKELTGEQIDVVFLGSDCRGQENDQNPDGLKFIFTDRPAEVMKTRSSSYYRKLLTSKQ